MPDDEKTEPTPGESTEDTPTDAPEGGDASEADLADDTDASTEAEDVPPPEAEGVESEAEGDEERHWFEDDDYDEDLDDYYEVSGEDALVETEAQDAETDAPSDSETDLVESDSESPDAEPSSVSESDDSEQPAEARKPGLVAALKKLRKEREDEPPGGREMDFLDHLGELRDRLIKVILLVVLGTCLCWSFYDKQVHVVVVDAPRSVLLRLRVRLVPDSQRGEGSPARGFPAGQEVGEKLDLLQQKVARLEERLSRLEEQLHVVPDEGDQTDTGGGADRATPRGERGERVLLRLPSLWGFLLNPVRDDLERQGIITLFHTVMEPLLVRFEVVLAAGIILLSPLIFYQVWAFIYPALYAHERKAVMPLIPASFVLFWCGVALAYKVIPVFFLFLLSFANEAQVLNSVKWYVPFLAKICLSLGLVFQMPIVFWLLGKLGIITSGALLRVWRHAVVVIFIIAAIITPTWDPFNLCLLAVPMCGLYFLSVFLVYLTQRAREKEAEESAESEQSD